MDGYISALFLLDLPENFPKNGGMWRTDTLIGLLNKLKAVYVLYW